MNSILLVQAIIYLGKMTLISAFLYGYYWIFLRNAAFHPYNRWYLLGSTLLSLILPLLHILYGLIAACFIAGFLRSLFYLSRLPGKYSAIRLQGIRFFQTDEPGTPFSFFNRLFWNKQLALDTVQGQSIFRHELYHIRRRHTWDILGLTILRSLFWPNPFLVCAFTAQSPSHPSVATSGNEFPAKDPAHDLIRHYLHYLRYPAAVLQQQEEGTIWFSVKLGDDGALLGFQQYDAAPDLGGKKEYAIVVTSRAVPLPANSGEPEPLTADRKRDMFLEEARSASETIPSEKKQTYAAGEYFFTVTFRLEKPLAGDPAASLQQPYRHEAEFPGGARAWLAFLTKNSRYPSSAVSKKQQGKVIVKFRVDKDGNVGDIKLATDPVPGSRLGEEAIRVIRLSGKWEPATKDGKPVASYKEQPIVFKLN